MCDAKRHEHRTPVREAGDRLHTVVGLDDHDARALTAEEILVGLLRRHRHERPHSRICRQTSETLTHLALDYHGDACPWVGVPAETPPARKGHLAHVEGPGAKSTPTRRAGVDPDRRHLDSLD